MFRKKRREAKIREHVEIVRELNHTPAYASRRIRKLHRELKYYNDGAFFTARYRKEFSDGTWIMLYLLTNVGLPGLLSALLVRVAYFMVG